MKEIQKENLENIKGGISAWGALGIGALITFIAGIIDGIARPSRCN